MKPLWRFLISHWTGETQFVKHPKWFAWTVHSSYLLTKKTMNSSKCYSLPNSPHCSRFALFFPLVLDPSCHSRPHLQNFCLQPLPLFGNNEISKHRMVRQSDNSVIGGIWVWLVQNCSALEDYLQAHLANNSAGPSSVWKSHEKYTAYKIRTD